MTTKLSLIEVYRKVMQQAEAFEERAKLQKGTKETITLAEADENYSMDFYQCAKWLEETEEINPTK